MFQGIYSHDQRRAYIQPGLPNVKAQKDKFGWPHKHKWSKSIIMFVDIL